MAKAIGLLLLLGALVSPAAAFAQEKGAIPKLVKVLADKRADTVTRMEAAKRLGVSGDLRALSPLVEALKDSNKAVRWVAVEALGDLGDRRAVPALFEYLEKGEAYGWGKKMAMETLGSLKDARAVDPLIRFLSHEDPFLRKAAAMALARVGDDRAIPALARLLQDEEGWLSRLAQRLLVQLGGERLSGEVPRDTEAWARWYQAHSGPRGR